MLEAVLHEAEDLSDGEVSWWDDRDAKKLPGCVVEETLCQLQY